MKKFGICLSITPYASMRLGTYWLDHDFNDYNPSWTDDDDDGGLMLDIADISRFGAKGQVGDIFGHVELGLTGDENQTEYDAGGHNFHEALGVGENSVYTRLLYGRWNFEGGSLTIGQDYTPVTWVSGQEGPGVFDDRNTQSYDLQNVNIGAGCMWDSRRPQIRVNLDNGLSFSIIQPEDEDPPGIDAALPYNDVDIDVKIPKMVIAYDYKAEGIHLRPGIAYQTYEVEDDAGVAFSEDIDSWIAFLHGKWDLASVAFTFTGYVAENLDNYGVVGTNPYRVDATGALAYDAGSAFIKADGSVEDAESFGGFINAAIPLDPYPITLGWGFSNSSNDAVDGWDEDDELMVYFVNCKIPIADNFKVTPEIGYWDGMENNAGLDDPDHFYVGMTWQMDF
jgi:hypothetical protein